MAVCSNCGQENPEGSAYCSACGTALSGTTTSRTQGGKSFFMPPDRFRAFFERAILDTEFRKQLQEDPCGLLLKEGVRVDLSPAVRKTLESALALPGTVAAKCGVCGVCGACGLCGEVDFGAASAALWAIFSLDLIAAA